MSAKKEKIRICNRPMRSSPPHRYSKYNQPGRKMDSKFILSKLHIRLSPRSSRNDFTLSSVGIDADAPGRETATAEAAEAIFSARSAPNRSSIAKKKPRKVSPAAVVSTTGTLNISQ